MHFAAPLEPSTEPHFAKQIYPQQFVQDHQLCGANAEEICEAVGRPNMRFVLVKDVEQQAVLALQG